MHEHIKDICRRLAKAGYFAIAPELYARQGDVVEDDRHQEIIRRSSPRCPTTQVMSDLDATVAWAKADGKADTREARRHRLLLGRADRLALCARTTRNVKAGGRLVRPLGRQADELHPKNPLDIAADLKAPVLGLYGGADQGIPVSDVEKMRDGAARRPASLRDRGLSRHAARLQRRLPPELPPGRRQGRLEAHARLVQEARRGIRRDLYRQGCVLRRRLTRALRMRTIMARIDIACHTRFSSS